MLADNLERQLAHWMSAARELPGRRGLRVPHGVGVAREHDRAANPHPAGPQRRRVIRSGRAAADVVRGSRTDPRPARRAGRPQRFRRLYLQVETTLDFFGQAVNSRTSPQLRATMQALDRLARQSIETTLRPLGITSRPC